MNSHNNAWLAPGLLLAALAVFPALAPHFGLDYYTGFVMRMLIVMLIATSLNFLMGYGGMVALGHAGFVGVGAYALVAMTEAGITNAWALWGGAMLAAAVAALLVGAVSLRTRGVYFIMITLAFAQMLYYLAVSLRAYGGDDGYNLMARPLLGFGLNADDDATLYWVVLAVCALCFLFFHHAIGSRFGQALIGVRDNESRMLALGYPVFLLKLQAFVIAAAVAGLGGALMVTQNSFISPSSMHWSQSAVLIVIVVLGGLGHRWGGVIGAAVWVSLEEVLRMSTEYWHWPLGALLIAIILFAPDGLGALCRCRAAGTGAARVGFFHLLRRSA
ncbi:putative branched-chain amino acid transport permease [Azoarcus olearius]|uniref:branched-chain amino acid ABC transporter permease n=1 Tax=Azoarcus sp. (strain BH72) TaxID=418699 RepID=UPI0008061479|nr:branched-chain amino acid ABC transporter permease [Azoarcus olearius]ANQ84291.1 putative branched-chain amino acid transport permease [Azoarcus olearius]